MSETAQDAAPSPKPDWGSALRQKRLKRGQSLEAVYQHTRIPKKYLEAMETNRMEDFPAAIYLRGFLKSYCDYLDLDFDSLWSQIDAAPDQAAPKKAKQEPPARHRRDEVAGPAMLLPFTESTLLPFLLVMGLAVAGAALWFFTGHEGGAPSPKRISPSETLLEVVEPPKAAPIEIQLHVAAVNPTWMRLKADGVLRFEGRLPAGAPTDWRAKEAFSLRAIDPQNLRLQLNGKELQLTNLPKGPDGSYKITR